MKTIRVVLALMTVAPSAAVRAAGTETVTDTRLLEAQTAFAEATRLMVAGKYNDAMKQGERTLAIREAVLGATHLEVATSLNLLGELHLRWLDSRRALTYFERALAIREAVLGQNHPDVAQSLNNLGIACKDQGLYSRTQMLHERALAIREASLGKNHPDVAQSLNSLANVYVSQGAYDRAAPLYERALAIREIVLGKDHPDVAESLDALGMLYWWQALYGRAEPLFERAVAIQEAALGKNHPEVAELLIDLAQNYHDQGLFGRAEPFFERALAIREAALGKDHIGIADVLARLASLYKDRGFYGRAEALFERTLAIQEAILGKNHRDVAASLNGLAHLYAQQGLYGRAESLYQRALAIREVTRGKNHPDVATVLNNLAEIYAAQGLYARAELLYERALSIFETAFGKNNLGNALVLHNLAALARAQRLYTRAESLYQRALTIREAGAGKSHHDVATSLSELAELYTTEGLYARAEPLHERALAIREAALGKRHPDVAISLNGLARLRLAQQRVSDALPLFQRAFSLSESRLRQEALDFSESRLATFLQFLRSEEELLYSLLRSRTDDARVRRLALSSVLLRKGRSVEETANTSRTIHLSLGEEDRKTFERLRDLRTQLATLSHQGPGSLSPADYQQRLQSLAEQGDALETQLARHSSPLRALSARPGPAEIVDRVAAALPRDSALVEFVAYTDRPVVPKPGTPQSQLPGELRYLALVLLPNSTIHSVDLGPAAAMDQAASTFRDALASSEAAWQGSAQALHSLAFLPLRPLLGNVRRLFLSPDGQLNLVPFAALHDGQRLLVDSFHFTYLTSGKDLLPRPQDIPPSRSIVVLADPDFGASPSTAPGAHLQPPSLAQRSASAERFFSTLRADLAERTWVSLPGTRQEAAAIQQLLPQAQLFVGAEASKQRLLDLPAPGVLHIATHGFFLEDSPTPTASRAVGQFGALSGAPSTQHLPDPLLRSGLVLSGAASQLPHSPDSSLTTALELAGLNLWGTELVVLSACETGRGDVKLGQGVYGLRRALLSAGAETVVSSLWKVNDDTTRQLMEGYYRHLLAGKPRVSALREAMLELRQEHPHPYAWAPFIALGRDAPLRSLAPLPKK